MMIVLPSYIRESVVMTEDEKKELALISALPTSEEVDSVRASLAIQEILNAFIGDETTRDIHLQLKAQEYLNDSNLFMAWCVLLL